ncbi:hypothetical protein LZ31DRAFT_567171 [Colletotrichum somersetense]|nr:hypothetical protein LZ31DRAFT_567171 [Colletotrichum somersetense]
MDCPSVAVLGASCHFLHLPLEIRLQIYGWVHDMHPVEHAQLAPWYPNPISSAYLHRLVKPQGGAEDRAGIEKAPGHHSADEDERSDSWQGGILLSPRRPLCGIPSSLMCTSKQVYNECRALPLHTNEFVFVNWFSSGLCAARAFTRGLEPWQRDEMRFARLEMLGRNFTGPTLKEWIELCGHWASGLRGLRLKVLVGGGPLEPTTTFAALNGNAEARALGLATGIAALREPAPEWIEEGLKQMRALTRLEIELTVLDWDNDEKIAWCAELGRILNDGRREAGRERVVVRCVERLVEERWPKRQVSGEPAKN